MSAKPFVQAGAQAEPTTVLQPTAKPDLTAPRVVLKQRGTMVMLNPQGLMPRSPDQALGMFADDTRGLRELDLRIGGHPLTFVSGGAESSFNASFLYDAPLLVGVKAGAVSAQSGLVINDDQLFYRVVLANSADESVAFDLELSFGAGFEDVFEVRGSDRKQRGVVLQPHVKSRNVVELAYVGLDAVHRSVQVEFGGQTPAILAGNQAVFNIQMLPGQQSCIELRVSYKIEKQPHPGDSGWSFEQALASARAEFDEWMRANASIDTSNVTLNQVVAQAVRDINMLRLGPLGIAAGLPQFAVPFGRDSAITGLQTCWLMPQLSRNIILALAAYQGTKYDATTAEEPGKIMHELRTGEMVNTGEAPFGPYYGTVDATQLWLMLIAEYTRWTGDLALSAQLWPKIEAAVSFLRRRSRRTGFITYGGRPGEALANQCWKDSYNSIMYSDGKLAEAPIAVCEAQGYMYAAFGGVAELARKHRKHAYARRLGERGKKLKTHFQRHFWMPKLNFLALALDKHHRQCDVISSNPGHLLGLGILTPRQEKLVAERMMQPDMFNGWFIRTLASSEVAYDESDYQRGSGWPHDNGFAAVGMRKIGHYEDAVKVFAAHVDIASAASDFRLHELYCGNARTPDAIEPVHYKVACVPQAWAAGSILHMLRACVNLVPEGTMLKIVNPRLPEWLPSVAINNLRVGGGSVNLHFVREADGSARCAVQVVEGEVTARVMRKRSKG
jgi:glycogen debranching enzyme